MTDRTVAEFPTKISWVLLPTMFRILCCFTWLSHSLVFHCAYKCLTHSFTQCLTLLFYLSFLCIFFQRMTLVHVILGFNSLLSLLSLWITPCAFPTLLLLYSRAREVYLSCIVLFVCEENVFFAFKQLKQRHLFLS